jgi:hypothetical protein
VSRLEERTLQKLGGSAAVNAGPGLPPFEVETVERAKLIRDGENTG